MNATILNYLKEQRLASICCIDEAGAPYCFNCYFGYDEENQWLYFKSNPATMHAQLLLKNGAVAGTILPRDLSPLDTRGIQFKATLIDRSEVPTYRASRHYYSRYPFAMAIPGQFFALQLEEIKLTENRNGIKGKWLWRRSEQAVAVAQPA